MLMCIVAPKELPKYLNMIKEIDKKAFIIIGNVNEVIGEGFKQISQLYIKNRIGKKTNMDFKGKTALITGAAVGIGRAVAIKMAQNHAKLVLADLNFEKLEEL